jgi:magnesium-transporting ATPase (P-type)
VAICHDVVKDKVKD